jgi:succinate-semialdehyde dehydrogenase / glutarate-semialdehyde dehydrogenase
MKLKSINPYTNELLGETDEYPGNKVEEIIAQAAGAFRYWKITEPEYRRSLMNNAGSLLRKNLNEFSRAITLEMGKPVSESTAEVEKCAWACDYYAGNSEDFLKEEPVQAGAYWSSVCYEPLGTVLGIMPWNFPFWQVFRFAVPTLMAGNTVVLKHASNVQLCAQHIERLFAEAGFPPGVFSNLAIGSHRVKKVIGHEAIQAVSLTGSEQAGISVAEEAGRNIKKCVLELGGSNAFVVLDDADLEKAAEIGVRARMANAGQSCIAAKRFILNKSISDRFIKLFTERVGKLKHGDPMEKETGIGTLASISQAETVERQVLESVKMGARILTGGARENAFYAPSVILDVKPGMPLFDEEVFGPVAPIIIARDTGEAISLANRTKFGLGVSLFTNDLVKARTIVTEFRDGAVFINDLVKSDPRLPFGGTGRSGYGRELSLHGIREFVNVKTVYAQKF